IFALIFLFCLSPNLNAQIIKDDFRVNDDTTGGDNYNPDIAILESGEAIIVWRDGRNGTGNIYGQSYDNAGALIGTNLKVSTRPGNMSEYDPAVSSYGDSLLVIFEYGHAQWLLSNGTQCGSSFYLQSGSIYDPDVAVSDSGFFVVWRYSVSGSGQEIFLKRFNLDGDSLGPRMVVNDDGTSYNQYDPKIAMDVSGNFVVVWRDYRNGSDYDIYGQLFNSSGGSIGSNFLINDDVGSTYQYGPSVSMDSSGNFTVVWYDNRNGDYDIYGQRFDPTGDTTGLGGNFLINDDGGSWGQYDPSCGMDKLGNFVVVWGDDRDGNRNIYGQIYDNGGNPQGSNFRIDQCPGTEGQYNPSVSMNENNFAVTWEDSRKDRSIYKRRYNNSGTPVANEMRVNDVDGTKNQQYPAVDMNAAGNVVVTWGDYRIPNGIYFQRLTADGAPIGVNSWIYYGNKPDVSVAGDGSFVITYDYYPNIYYQMFNASGDSIGSPQIANDTIYQSRYSSSIDMDALGNFIVAWHDYRNGDYDIYAQRFDSSGDTIDVNFRVNDDVGTTSQDNPVIAISPSGRFLITWYDYRNGDSDIYGQVYDASGSPVSTNFRIDGDAGTNGQYYPDAAVLSDGNFIVAWYDYRSPQGIYAQVIDSLGAPVDTNFKVSDAYGYYPSVSASPTGGFVVTWYCYQGSNPTNIFAQRYNPDYSPDGSNYQVNNEIEGLNPDQYNPDVATDGTNIIFTWQGPKWQKGFDIAVKVVEWNFNSVDEIETFTESIKLLPNIPNPFSESTIIRYSVDKPREVRIGIYDLTGREVCTLVDGKVGTGVHRVTWNGMNSKGDGVPAGIYFCRLESGDKIQSRKMVLLR
ncbi:T9SS type A sorting domain-containing protein, partial [candidate division WOR-3 bacterium]|nr:T9SS type A sorting domain-containing protein [candidate division WOR-3 bacterium]